MAPDEEKELKSQLDKYLAAGQIERARSPFGAGVLFARKKDGTLRLCIDYRALNKITKMDKYPLPRIDEMLDEMRGAHIFSKLDLQQGYHQIRVVPEHIERTAFNTKFGSFQFKVMPFGLCNAPATFQRTMNLILEPLRKFAAVYIDDIIIHSSSLEDHLDHLRQVFDALRAEKLYAKASKCAFLLEEVDFCGFVVGSQGIRTQHSKVEAIQKSPPLQNAKDVRSFLGLCGFYQKFIKNYSHLVASLTDLLKKDAIWKWEQPQIDSFENLKKAMCRTCELAYPDTAKPFVVHLDASQVALGATLSQETPSGELRLITCISRKLNAAERNYPTHEREMLAMVHALKTWKHYLMGIFTTVYTDSMFLKFLTTMKAPSPRVTRWLAELALYHFEVKHIPGSTNTAADALSRIANLQLAIHSLEIDNESSWEDAYKADPMLLAKYFTENGDLKDSTKWHNGRLWEDDLIVVPEAKITSVLTQHHDNMIAGHWEPQNGRHPSSPIHIPQDETSCACTCQLLSSVSDQQSGKVETAWLLRTPVSSDQEMAISQHGLDILTRHPTRIACVQRCPHLHGSCNQDGAHRADK